MIDVDWNEEEIGLRHERLREAETRDEETMTLRALGTSSRFWIRP